MIEKMKGSHYPKCTSKQRSFSKNEDVSGVIKIEDGNLVFEAQWLMVKLPEKSFTIPLKEIEKVETMNLNLVMPFGVCIYMQDGSECMLGHIKNKKLAAFINEAIDNNC